MPKPKQKWYMARLLFRSFIQGEPGNLAEDTLRLIRATSLDEARKKAKAFGKAYEHSYKNPYKQTVRWKMVEVLDVMEITDKLQDGAEVYSLMLVPREFKQVQNMFILDKKTGRRWVRDA